MTVICLTKVVSKIVGKSRNMESEQRWHPRSLQEGPNQASTFAVSITFIVITGLVIALRFHVRFSLVQGGLGLDDRKYRKSFACSTQMSYSVSHPDLMAIGLVFTVALSVATMMCGWYGAGAHGKSTERHSAFRR
jgi:hypothetical protein